MLDLIVYGSAFFGLYTSIFMLLIMIDNAGRLKNPTPRRFPTASIIVPACNEEHAIGKTIQSLLDLDYPSLKIIVVDDGSIDDTYEIAKQFVKGNKNVRVLSKENGGKGNAVNYGLKHVETELVGCLDADSFVDRFALKKMVGYFRDPLVMCVTPSLKCVKPITFWQRIQSIEFLLGVYLRKAFSFMDAIHVTPGPFSIFRKRFFTKHGGFDESTVTEDIEIALRVQKLGYKIENAIDANVYAVGMPTLALLRKQRIRWYRGFLDNISKYTGLFSWKYGDLGFFILPSALVSVLIALTLTTVIFYNAIESWIKILQNIISVDFDLWKLRFFQTDLFFVNQSPIMWIGLISLLIGVAVLFITYKLSNEHDSIVLNFILFSTVYIPIYALWWLDSIISKTFKGPIEWTGRVRTSDEIKYT